MRRIKLKAFLVKTAPYNLSASDIFILKREKIWYNSLGLCKAWVVDIRSVT